MLIQIIDYLLSVLWWIIIIQFVLSILIAFNVINTHSDFVRSVWRGLNVITEPIYRPFRRVLPDLGTIDLAPMAVLVTMGILQTIVLPALYRATLPYAI
ncbi:YggT family protein [Sphingomonas sp. 3-13AW]|uniref:YggT family protein n=1 Tax=Sphingomonas sp. 3-13AW TaxID=3050450 RepID=UPI003BB59279